MMRSGLLRVVVVAVVAAVVVGVGAMAGAQTKARSSASAAKNKPTIKTDLGHYDPGPAPELPEAGGTFVDPVFGTTILRVTDARDGKQNHVAYSYWPTFNLDNTRLHISCNGEPTLYDFDPEKLNITKVGPLFAKATPVGGRPRWEDCIWSGTDPNVIFGHDLRRLWAYNVKTQEYTLLKDFEGKIQQMSRSIDDNVFAFSGRSADGTETAGLVWQRDADKLTRHDAAGINEVQIDKSGRFLSITFDAQGAGVISVRVLDLQTGKTDDLLDDEPDYAPGHSDNGHDLRVGHDNFRNQITGRRLSTPHEHITILDLKRDWFQGQHISLLGDDERWAVLSFFGDKPSEFPFRNEIFQVATDGSGRVRRLAHHRSVFGGEYWQIPLANISRDGRFIAYGSNYNGSGQTDVFILVVPPFTKEEEYPLKSHPLIGDGKPTAGKAAKRSR